MTGMLYYANNMSLKTLPPALRWKNRLTNVNCVLLKYMQDILCLLIVFLSSGNMPWHLWACVWSAQSKGHIRWRMPHI